MTTLDTSKHYAVRGYDGIAFYIVGKETIPDADTEWTGIEQETDNYIVVMVGDDHKHIVSPDDLMELNDDEFCPECGQIGCDHYQ